MLRNRFHVVDDARDEVSLALKKILHKETNYELRNYELAY